MAEISVIVPVYKVEAYLSRCVDSVLNQTYSDFELILVDDGSPDSCPLLCDAYEKQDPRVHVIHQKNGGLSAARNAGLDWVMSRSQSHWITFLDSDDWIHREFLERLYHMAVDQQAQIAMCGFCRVSREQPDQTIQRPQCEVMDPESAYVTYYGYCMTACCKLVRRELLQELRFPLGKLHEDAFITHRILFSAEKVAIFPEKLYYYYFNADSITRKEWTPKRLEELEGHRVRMAFLKEHGFRSAQEAELEVIVSTLYEHAAVLGTMEENQPWLKEIRKELRSKLKEAEKQGISSYTPGKRWIYLMAYLGNPTWLFLQKLRGILTDMKKSEG